MNQQDLDTLRQLINNRGTGFLTAEQGTELAKAGFIAVDPDERHPDNPNAVRVTVTEQGLIAMNQSAPIAPPPAPTLTQTQAEPEQSDNSGFEIQSNVPIPKVKRGRSSNLKPRTSIYPFDKLQEGQSFHVPATADDPNPQRKMASNVSAANRRYEVAADPPEMVIETKRKMRKDENGKPVLDENGKRIYDEIEQQVQKTVPTRHFLCRSVGEDDPNGPGVRVFRVPLNFAG